MLAQLGNTICRVASSTRACKPQSLHILRSFSQVSNGKKKHYHERRRMNYTCDQLYDVVSNVDSYKTFVPWCRDSKVLKRTSSELEAELVVGFGFFNEKYTSVVKLEKPVQVTAISHQTNLLEYLTTEWRFSPSSSDPKKTWVTFKIEFKFKSSIYNQVSEMFMKEVVDKMVQAFETKCKKEYFKNSTTNLKQIMNVDS